jgi:two-component system response regulator RegA
MVTTVEKSQRVLFVDDDALYIAACKRQARRTKDIASATTCDEAKRLAATTRFDLAIVDYILGNQSCLKLVEELKRGHPAVSVVVVSSFMCFEVARLAGEAGVDAVYAKPIGVDEIVARLERKMELALDHRERHPAKLGDIERAHISRVLRDCDGDIPEAARQLGIHRATLQRKLRKRTDRD